MKRQIYFATFFLLAMLISAISEGGLPDSPSPPLWKLVDQSGKIQIYDRWLTVGLNSKARERKSEFVVNCTCERAKRLITDPNFSLRWMKELEASKMLEKKDDGAIVYSLFDLPWPFKKRELYSLYKESVYEDGYVVSIRSIDDCEYNSRCVLLTGYRAEWKFRKIDENSIRITFITFTSTPPLIPLFLQDPILFAVYKQNLHTLIGLLESKDEIGF